MFLQRFSPRIYQKGLHYWYRQCICTAFARVRLRCHVNYNRGQKYGYILYSPYHHGHAVWLYLINKKASFYQKKSGRSSKATNRKIKSPQKVCICFVLRFERNEPTPTGRPQSYLRVGWRKVFFQDDCGARLASKEEIA